MTESQQLLFIIERRRTADKKRFRKRRLETKLKMTRTKCKVLIRTNEVLQIETDERK